MKLGLHTYSLYMHGIGQAWTGFTSPWPRQLSTFQLFDLILAAAEDDLVGFGEVHFEDGANAWSIHVQRDRVSEYQSTKHFRYHVR